MSTHSEVKHAKSMLVATLYRDLFVTTVARPIRNLSGTLAACASHTTLPDEERARSIQPEVRQHSWLFI